MNRILLLSIIFLQLKANAIVTLPAVIGSNMVLQQQSTIKLWGWGNPGEKVFISPSWNARTDSTITDGNGKWQLNFDTPVAGGPYTIIIKADNTIILDNILIGEVWICSGQSNMEFNYNWGLEHQEQDTATTANNNIRFFNIPRTTALYPQENVRANWVVCDSNSWKSFSAVGYYFGRRLQKQLNVPIGLISACWSGTPAETWTPTQVINADTLLKQAATKQNSSPWWPTLPGLTYNGMISPVTPFSIAGAIWYQGESNTASPNTYSALLQSMISSWREQWQRSFPFYLVQIAPYKYGNRNVGALLREQQLKSTTSENTGLVVIDDLVKDVNDIHPKNKYDVGIRLANLALDATYHKEVKGRFPVYNSMKLKNGKVYIHFSNLYNGLLVKGKKVNELFIAGADGIFYPAESKLEHDKLVVWSKKVKAPEYVRYAFSNTAIGNLFSKEGLPVVPIRTDNLPVDTAAE
ncbi:MAG TPA: sialate O-acetylesterase [Flavisolibacter sp.]|nr:sialate O-acetylesterase [Flavisolibacter sp.]